MISRLIALKQMMARHPNCSILLFLITINILFRYMSRVSFAWPSVVRPAPPPRRFFPRSSVVIDFPYGDISGMTNVLERGDVDWMFTMYYAPWCARSMATRAEFDKAAQLLGDEIRFVAINCWHENGSCRRHNNFPRFPVLYLHHLTISGIRYSGVLTADYMVQFLLVILNPLTRISTQLDLVNFISTTDTAVIGYFDFSSSRNSSNYKQFYYAALRSLERDPRNQIRFGVVTERSLADDVGLNSTSSFGIIRSLNTSLKYPSRLNFTSSSITQWIFAYRQEPALRWLLPSGLKSLSLSSELQRGPAVIAFVDGHPLSIINRHVSVLREIALRYHNCNDTLMISDLFARAQIYEKFKAMLGHCAEVEVKNLGSYSHSVLTSLPYPAPLNQCCVTVDKCDRCIHYEFEHPRSSSACSLMHALNIGSAVPSHDFVGCVESVSHYNTAEYFFKCCREHDMLNRTILPADTSTRRLADNNLHEFITDDFVLFGGLHRFCKLSHLLLNSDSKLGESLHADDLKHEKSFVGLGCRSNRSVHFYAMDRKTFYGSEFEASLLGARADSLPVFNNSGRKLVRPTVVLVDIAEQVLHVMKGKFSHKNLANLVMNFSSGSLTPFHRSMSTSSGRTLCPADSENSVCVIEVTSKNFSSIVLNSKKDVLLLYYAPYCGFCSRFAHVYLALANRFRRIQRIVFARINADSNDLPWKFRVDRYPTLVYFPADNKVESIVFPPHLELSLANLVTFVRRATGPSAEMETCSSACIRTNLRTAVATINRLLRRRDRLLQAIEKVRHRLSDVFNVSHSWYDHGIENDELPLGTNEEVITQNQMDQSHKIEDGLRQGGIVVTADVELTPVGVGEDRGTYLPARSLCSGSEKLCHLLDNLASSTSDRDASSENTNNAVDDLERKSDEAAACNIEQILRTRDELAVLRRRLYLTEEHLMILRYTYVHVLIPSLSHGAVFLERRRWLALRKLRKKFTGRTSNYYDFVSGWDVVSY